MALQYLAEWIGVYAECLLLAISRHSEGSSRTSALPPRADIGGARTGRTQKADIRCLLSQWKTLSAKGPKFSTRSWKNISIRMPDRSRGQSERIRTVAAFVAGLIIGTPATRATFRTDRAPYRRRRASALTIRYSAAINWRAAAAQFCRYVSSMCSRPVSRSATTIMRASTASIADTLSL